MESKLKHLCAVCIERVEAVNFDTATVLTGQDKSFKVIYNIPVCANHSAGNFMTRIYESFDPLQEQ